MTKKPPKNYADALRELADQIDNRALAKKAEHLQAAKQAGSRTGAGLRLLRLSAGMTLGDVADAAGVDAGYVSKVENGHVIPRAEWVFTVCDAIGEHLAQSDA